MSFQLFAPSKFCIAESISQVCLVVWWVFFFLFCFVRLFFVLFFKPESHTGRQIFNSEEHFQVMKISVQLLVVLMIKARDCKNPDF